MTGDAPDLTPLDGKTLEAIADLICGNEGPYYRKGWELPQFFRNAGLTCPNHDGSTRKWWVLERLKEFNKSPPEMRRVLLRIADPREYSGAPNPRDILNEVLSRLNRILAPEGLSVKLVDARATITKIPRTVPENELTKEEYVLTVPDFPLLTSWDTTLSDILVSRWKEVSKCVESGAYLAGIILLGSVLEGVLLAIVIQEPEAANRAAAAPKDNSGKVKKFGDWSFSDLINVAHEAGWIQLDAKRFSHILREYRNLVHPWEQREKKETPDEDTCRICWQVVKAAINDIERWRRAAK